MWCPDDIGRDSWDWVGPPAWGRACFNSPEWGGGSSPLKTDPPQIVLLLFLLVLVVVVVRTVELHTCVCPYAQAARTELKRTSASALVPSAGLTSRKKTLRLFPPKAGSRRPQCKYITQLQVEEKDCEARPPHPPLLRRKGSAIFSISSGLDAPGPEYHVKYHLDVSFW